MYEMYNMISIADAVNDKINRIIKKLERIKGVQDVSYFIEILNSIKIWDIRINTDNEVYIAFKDQEIVKFNTERSVIK